MGQVPIVAEIAPIESVLCTEELSRRQSRPADYRKENRALVVLAKALSESPRKILQILADTIVETLGVGSAGVSLLTRGEEGEKFYWPAIAGEWTAYIGGGTPRDFGPCGDVLDRNTPLLFNHPERRYTYLESAKPAVEEALLVPFYVEGKAVGTIWAVAHNLTRKFDHEDERLLNSLALFASSAYQVTSALETQETSRQQAITFDTTLSTITDFAYIFDREGRFQYVNKALLDLWGLRLEQALGKNFFDLKYPDDLAERLQRQIQQVIDTRQGLKDETPYTSPTGAGGYYEYIFQPVLGSDGQVESVAGSTRDISARKKMESELLDAKARLEAALCASVVDGTERKRAEEGFRKLAETLEAQVQIRTQELEAKNAEILQQSEQLRDLSNRLLVSQDEERRRIARDLHDSAGQTIVALGMNLDLMTQEGMGSSGPRRVEESRKLVRELSEEIRTMSYLLHPPLMDEAGLSGALGWYVEGLQQRGSGLKVELTLPPGIGRFSDETEMAVFRVVQECLTNIHRHSGASRATIEVSPFPMHILLKIKDNGKGIPAAILRNIHTRHSGVGITGMRERVRHLGGSMDITSDRNGTTVLVNLPRQNRV